MKSPNVTYFSQSDLKYTKNDLKYYDLKWDFPLGGLYWPMWLKIRQPHVSNCRVVPPPRAPNQGQPQTMNPANCGQLFSLWQPVLLVDQCQVSGVSYPNSFAN